MIVRTSLALGAILVALSGTAARAQDASDLLLATLWTQRSVEYKANALTVFALARIRLDEALADKGWKQALKDDVHLRAGLNVCAGLVTHPQVAEALGKKYVPAITLLG